VAQISDDRIFHYLGLVVEDESRMEGIGIGETPEKPDDHNLNHRYSENILPREFV
jgi:hypothetical protein